MIVPCITTGDNRKAGQRRDRDDATADQAQPPIHDQLTFDDTCFLAIVRIYQ